VAVKKKLDGIFFLCFCFFLFAFFGEAFSFPLTNNLKPSPLLGCNFLQEWEHPFFALKTPHDFWNDPKG